MTQSSNLWNNILENYLIKYLQYFIELFELLLENIYFLIKLFMMKMYRKQFKHAILSPTRKTSIKNCEKKYYSVFVIFIFLYFYQFILFASNSAKLSHLNSAHALRTDEVVLNSKSLTTLDQKSNKTCFCFNARYKGCKGCKGLSFL